MRFKSSTNQILNNILKILFSEKIGFCRDEGKITTSRVTNFFYLNIIHRMKQSIILHRLILLVALFLSSLTAWSQVTTSSVSGYVQSNDGEALPGARVEATHQPSGTRYGAVSNAEGRYVLPNMRVGGPYEITISMQGFESQKFDGLYLTLGQKLALNSKLMDKSKNLGEVVVTANVNDVMNNQRTGAANNIRREQIATLPTISRSASDYTRLSPQSDGNSFGGRNDQFNNFSLDGTIFNNPFGLDAATPGGQTDAQPISLDAIDQIQVAYAPFDVTQSGFTGAAVNAVTKSGTNTVSGTVFGFFRNQSMIGSKVDGAEAPKGDLTQFQTGFSLGGPIIKNKLFYFVNAETERRSDVGSAYVANRGVDGPGVSRVLASDLDAVRSALQSRFQYETGDYENYIHKAPNLKGIAKLDWNISTNHKFSLTYNFLNASKQKPAHPNAIGRRGPDFTTLQFRNSGYQIDNKLYSGIAELKSVFGDKFANKFQAGYSAFRDSRDPFSTAFPVLNINKNGTRYIVAGHEPFSIYNKLNQDVIQLNDNLNIYLGKHTLTVGAAFEKFMFDNSFNLNAYGGTFGIVPPGRDFNSVQEFLDSLNTGFLDPIVAAAKATAANTPDDGWNWSYTNLGQISAYVQDEIAVNNKFLLTLGLRMDKPEYFNTSELIKEKIAPLTPPAGCCYFPDNEYYTEDGTAVKFDHTVLPKETPLFSPRLGFNYDIKGDKTSQLRGGSGLFTGRFPFVWIGNQVANPNFFFYCVTDPNFKYLQVWRNNLGYDHRWAGGWTTSIDLMYTKDINSVMVRNYGIKPPTSRLNAPGDNRPIYGAANHGSNNAYVLTNTNVGYSTNVTLQVQRTWANGMSASLAYNFLDARDASSIDAEISSDAYDRNPAYGNVNEAVLAPSLYGNRHRVVGSFSRKFSYGAGKWATTVGAFFQYAQGGRFSYTYSGDLNGDGSGLNDLMYIPTDAQIDQMAFAATPDATEQQQRDAFKAFVAQDDYMSDNRGKVVEKYGILSPWYNNWDVRILQDLNHKAGKKTNTVQLSLDILNVGNLINNGWSVRRLPTTTQPLGVVSVTDGVPTYSFDPNIKESFVQDFGLLSRWQAQVGIRYIF